MLKRAVKLTACGFAKANAIALISWWRGGEVAVALRCVRNLLGQSLFIMRKTAAGQYHRTGRNLDLAIIATKNGAGHAVGIP